MNARLFCVASVLVIALTGCTRQKQQGGSQESSSQQQPSANGGTVKISPEVQQKVGLHTAAVQTRAVQMSFTAPGQLALNEERTVHVGSYADGRVVELEGLIGAYVRKGTVLAKLHSHSVHETRAALETARQEVSRQTEMVDYRSRMRDRMQRLLALKSSSPQELERAETDLHSAQTDLQNARISQQKEQIHLADLLGVPETTLKPNDTSELSPILAPIDGEVVDRKITLGAILEPGQEAFTISNLASLWMIASVNETDLPKLHLGSPASVLTQAYPNQPFEGRVTFIAPEVDPQTRTLQARILLANPAHKLHPGMFANAQISAGSSRRAIFIPEQALQDLNGGSIVFVEKQPGVYQPRSVEIAHRLNGEAEIAAGLKSGETIVTDGSFIVKSELLKSQIGQ